MRQHPTGGARNIDTSRPSGATGGVRRGDVAASLAASVIMLAAVLNHSEPAAVLTGVVAGVVPLAAAWAHRREDISTYAWKIALVAAAYCASWVALYAWRFIDSLGPCTSTVCALGAPTSLMMAGVFAIPLGLVTYQVICLRRVVEG